MTAETRHPRCSDAAEQRDDPRAGSASPVLRWLLVEQPGPWGRDAVMESRLDHDVAAGLTRRAAAAGVRVLLIRRHGRAGHAPQGRRHWALATSRPGEEAVRWGRFQDDEELLDLPLTGPLPPEGDGAPHHDPTRAVYLVCAHGRHDTCCAVRGRGVAAALDAQAPGQVWECSHVGGCRFAANVVVLPHGLYYGGTTPESTTALVEATAAGRVVPGLLRGRSALPAAAQAAEHHAREQLGGEDLTAVDAFRLLGSSQAGDGSQLVRLAVTGTDRVLQVAVARVATGAPALLTCAARRPGAPSGWQLLHLDESTASG